MDDGAFKLLESATQRTLHAHNFARTSSHASVVLTDLLGRYLHLLASTCAKHAAHAGRTDLVPADAFDALKDAGVDLGDLASFCATEAREMSRYAAHTARRAEDLVEVRNALALGLRADRDDAFPLFYGEVPPEALEEELMGSLDDEDVDVEMADADAMPDPLDDGSEAVLAHNPLDHVASRSKALLPPSPISIPSSPSRKRAREERYPPSPPNIPLHLPPLPRMSTYTDEHERRSPSPMSILPPVVHPPSTRPDNIVSAVGPTASTLQASTQASAADYTTPVPYDGSSLRDIPEWNLPQSYPFSALSQPQAQSTLPTPQTQPSLFGAYHHVLTHPPPKGAAPAANPQRHRVAVGLLTQNERQPRWEPPDTLFGASAPPMPQFSRNPPVLAIALNDPDAPHGDGPPPPTPVDTQGKDKATLPPLQMRPLIGSGQRIVPLINQPGSRIPDLSRQILAPPLYKRITRLAHPPALQRGSKRLVYGHSIPAPWNSGGSQATAAGGTAGAKDGAKGRLTNGKDGDVPAENGGPSTLPDARLYHTWEYDEKRYYEPLVANRGMKQKGAQLLIPNPPPATNGNGNPLRRLSTIALSPSPGADSPTTATRKNVISLPRRDSTLMSITGSSRRDSYMD